MKVEFRKVSYNSSPFQIEKDNVEFIGNFKKSSHKHVILEGLLKGFFPITCDKCGKDFDLKINEELMLKIYDGFCENEEDLDIIESFNSVIDFDAVIESEIEAIKSDYHYCEDCNKNKISGE